MCPAACSPACAGIALSSWAARHAPRRLAPLHDFLPRRIEPCVPILDLPRGVSCACISIPLYAAGSQSESASIRPCILNADISSGISPFRYTPVLAAPLRAFAPYLQLIAIKSYTGQHIACPALCAAALARPARRALCARPALFHPMDLRDPCALGGAPLSRRRSAPRRAL